MKTEERSDSSRPAEEPAAPAGRAGHRPDLVAAGVGALLVAVACGVGWAWQRSNGELQAQWPPLLASWNPHVGPGTPAALTVAAAVVAYGPALADRLPWRRLLLTAWATAMAWIFSLALIEGWYRGIARRLTTKHEYLRVIDRFDDIPAALRGFTDHIVVGPPGNWPAHVAGHPPGATLTFVWLDRIGLGGGAWAGVFCIVLGASGVAAVLIAVRALAGERLARRAAPFLALAPFAVWTGTSADGYFAGVAAWSIALLAAAATRRSLLAACASGLLFGWTCYLSYGLPLIALPLATVLLITRTTRPVLPFLAAALTVPLAFTLTGFAWWEAYPLLVERYYQGAGGVRPYAYWVWGNLAAATLAVGLATVAGLRRTLAATPSAALGALHPRRPAPTAEAALTLLVLAALLALLAADLSGMSKAETERIWQPFYFWLLPATALLPVRGRRGWLGAQAGVALLVNHLVWTGW
ncbi:hypothetical protein [Streptomyces albidoflavus]|uniref:hypothetical protein n=1 Tax=Streptomyces albidoflavus TaxID=1886 RepID=UPI0033CDC1E1